MGGLTFMFFCLITIGGLGFAGEGKSVQMAIGILLVISTLCNMITVGMGTSIV
jgi:SP family general alpha glucoside:H+ symporter-like MFS transporter